MRINKGTLRGAFDAKKVSKEIFRAMVPLMPPNVDLDELGVIVEGDDILLIHKSTLDDYESLTS